MYFEHIWTTTPCCQFKDMQIDLIRISNDLWISFDVFTMDINNDTILKKRLNAIQISPHYNLVWALIFI